ENFVPCPASIPAAAYRLRATVGSLRDSSGQAQSTRHNVDLRLVSGRGVPGTERGDSQPPGRLLLPVQACGHHRATALAVAAFHSEIAGDLLHVRATEARLPLADRLEPPPGSPASCAPWHVPQQQEPSGRGRPSDPFCVAASARRCRSGSCPASTRDKLSADPCCPPRSALTRRSPGPPRCAGAPQPD